MDRLTPQQRKRCKMADVRSKMYLQREEVTSWTIQAAEPSGVQMAVE